MTSISDSRTAALLILHQPNAIFVSSEQKSATSDNMIAVANGYADRIGLTKQPGQAQSRISETMFGAGQVSVVAEKLKLIERAGQALGLRQSDYGSAEDFVKAAKDAVNKILRQPGGHQIISQIEDDLDLNKLGISLDDLINSAADPEKRDKVTAALEKKLGKIKDHEDEDKPQSLLVSQDEAGIYTVT